MPSGNDPVSQDSARPEEGTLVTIEHREWSGPLPSPDVIAQFDNVVQNGAERIFKEWEREAEHRRAYEKKVSSVENFERVAGRIFAFLFSVSALAAAAYCASVGLPWPAGIIGGGTIGTVVLALTWQNRNRKP